MSPNISCTVSALNASRPSSSCRSQLRCDELEKQNKDFVSLHSVLQQEKKDITEYLKLSVADKDKDVDELLVELEKLQRADEQDLEALKLLHREQQQELQEQIDQLNAGMMGQGETVRGQMFVSLGGFMMVLKQMVLRFRHVHSSPLSGCSEGAAGAEAAADGAAAAAASRRVSGEAAGP